KQCGHGGCELGCSTVSTEVWNGQDNCHDTRFVDGFPLLSTLLPQLRLGIVNLRCEECSHDDVQPGRAVSSNGTRSSRREVTGFRGDSVPLETAQFSQYISRCLLHGTRRRCLSRATILPLHRSLPH